MSKWDRVTNPEILKKEIARLEAEMKRLQLKLKERDAK